MYIVTHKQGSNCSLLHPSQQTRPAVWGRAWDGPSRMEPARPPSGGTFWPAITRVSQSRRHPGLTWVSQSHQRNINSRGLFCSSWVDNSEQSFSHQSSFQGGAREYHSTQGRGRGSSHSQRGSQKCLTVAAALPVAQVSLQ